MEAAQGGAFEDAHVDYQIFPIPAGGGACLCLATTILQPVLDQYEKLFRDIGLHLGLIDLSTFNLVNLYVPLLRAEAGDVFVLNVTGSFFALMVLRDGIPLFYRAKSYAFADDASRESRGNLLLRELDGSFAYYRERLGGTAPARLRARVDFEIGEVARGVDRIGLTAEIIDPGRVARSPVRLMPRGAGEIAATHRARSARRWGDSEADRDQPGVAPVLQRHLVRHRLPVGPALVVG
jgi:hypothetical protein